MVYFMENPIKMQDLGVSRVSPWIGNPHLNVAQQGVPLRDVLLFAR